jgi:hypothetical protein
VGRAAKYPNGLLSELLDDAGVSRKGLARRVVEPGAARGVAGLNYDHSSVARWLAGQQPREPVPELIAEVLTGLLQRRVMVADLGMAPSAVAADVGLRLSGSWWVGCRWVCGSAPGGGRGWVAEAGWGGA